MWDIRSPMFEPRAMKVRGSWALASLGTCPRLVSTVSTGVEDDAVTPGAIEVDAAAAAALFDMSG
jgi:hypothetical protein